MIVDDEPLAQELIERFISRVPYLELVGKFDNAIVAVNGITTLKPDVVFLDVNMPEMTGLEFLESFTLNRPNIIITTAYPQYAIEGFEHDVVDYLLKPVSLSRFMKAISKLMAKLPAQMQTGTAEPADVAEEEPPRKDEPLPAPPRDQALPSPPVEKESAIRDKFFMVKEDKKLVKVNLNEIVFVEGMKDYVKIHLFDRFIVTHITMTKIAEMLPEPGFIRINRSFVVKISFIKLLEGNMIEMANGKKLPIGINYRESVKVVIQDWLL